VSHVTPTDGLCPRAQLDLAARRAVFGDQLTISVPADGAEFWGWYAEMIRWGRPFRLATISDPPTYRFPDRGPALWFSGGVESTYTRTVLADRGTFPQLLDIGDFPAFGGPDRRLGQIHFLCAAISASLGHEVAYLGMERQDLLLGPTAFSRGYVERHPVFAARWSEYQPRHRLQTICAELHKEQMIRWLHEREIQITGTCDGLSGGAWCGDCYKCFEAFYTAKAVGIDLGIPLTRGAFARYHSEYRAYVDSGFVDNFNNAYQHYVRLQISHQVDFEPDRDCVA
jgi:hypothetical protein